MEEGRDQFKNRKSIPALPGFLYEKIVISLCLGGIVMIGFLNAVYEYVVMMIG